VNLEPFANAPVALLPVLLFLAALVYLDSFQAREPAVGGCRDGRRSGRGGASYFANARLLDLLDIGFVTYARYVSPWWRKSSRARRWFT